MKHIRKPTMKWIAQYIAVALMIIGITMLSTGCTAFTVVKTGEQAEGSANGSGVDNSTFDPEGYVNTLWEPEVIPYMQENAKDVTEVLNALKSGADQAGNKFGTRKATEGSPWNFIVKGKGKVLTLNTETRAGFIELDLAPYDGSMDIKLAIGPVLKGSAIRDSLAFINFDEFKNQIQFAQIASAFNKKAYDSVISAANVDSLANQEIGFTGAFTADGAVVTVIPVVLGQSKEGN